MDDNEENGKVSDVKLNLGIVDPRREAEDCVKYKEKYDLIEVLNFGL